MCCGQKRALVTSPSQPRPIPRPMPRPMPRQAGTLGPQLGSSRPPVAGNSGTGRVAPALAGGATAYAAAPGREQATTASPPAPRPGDIAVRYLRATPVRVRGLITGRSYEFSETQRLAQVDPKDVPGLLSTELFRRG